MTDLLYISQLGSGGATSATDLVPVTQGSTGPGTGTTRKVVMALVAEGLLGWVNVKAYGAVGNGTTNDTVAIQAAQNALTAIGGGVLYFPPGDYLYSSTVFIDSNTCVMGGGPATTMVAIAGANWVTNTVGTSSYTLGSFRALFANRNWQSNTIVDERIVFCDFSANLDTAASVQRKALANMVSARNTEFTGLITDGGGGVIAHVHCEQSNIHDCVFRDFNSTATDHYSGCIDMRVQNNWYRQLTVAGSNPAIQFTGSNNDNTFNTAAQVVCTSNTVIITGTVTASVGAISITETGTGGVVNDADISHNYVDVGSRPAGGILCYGGGDRWNITNNIVRNVADYSCIFAIPNGYGTITRVRMAGNRVFDSSRTSGSGRMLSVDATGSTVLDNDMLNCTGTTAVYVNGTGSVLRLGNHDGSTLTNQYEIGAGVTFLGTLTGTWTPVFQFGGASVGITGTFTGTWSLTGDIMTYTMSAVFTSKGSSVGTATIVGAPRSAAASQTGNFRVTTCANPGPAGPTIEPLIRASSTGFTISTQSLAGVNWDNTYFSNTTNLSFTGSVRV